MKRTAAAVAVGLVFAGGFLAACGGAGSSEPRSSSDQFVSVSIVMSGTLTLVEEKTTP
jgi:hypothetical protein